MPVRWVKVGRKAITKEWFGRLQDQIYCVLRDQVVMHISQVLGGYISTCMCTSFSYLENGWMDCAEIWFAVRDTLALGFTHDRGGIPIAIRAHVCIPSGI